MHLNDVMARLESLGSAQTCKTFRNHGATGPMFGVKVEDLKTVLKDIKGDQELALALYATGNSDAMYLAGLAADGRKMTRQQLETWAEQAWWSMQSEYTVPWVAAESPFGRELALQWLDSPRESVASTGWATYACWVGLQPDERLDMSELTGLLDRVAQSIHSAPNRVRYCMNGFVIAVGGAVAPLFGQAMATAARIGVVYVDMGKTACKVPLAAEYLEKMEAAGRIGKKRKTCKC